MGLTQEEEETLSFFWFCAMILSGKDVAVTVHLSTDSGCFHAMTAESGNCDRKHTLRIPPPPNIICTFMEKVLL